MAGRNPKTSRGRVLINLLFIVLILSLAGCRRGEKAGGKDARQTSQQSTAELRVLNVAPLGKTESERDARSIVVIFDRPVVALQALSEERGPVSLKLDPPVKGRIRWLGSKTMAFVPDIPFPLASEIRVTIPAGTRAFDGSILRNDYEWAFQTPRPRLLHHFPSDGQKWLPLDTQILLVFNQAVDREKSRQAIALFSADESGGEKRLGFRLASPSLEHLKEAELDVPVDRSLLVVPDERLKPGHSYLVDVGPGLASREGSLRSEERSSFRFSTFEAFRFLGLKETALLKPDEGLQFRFSNPVEYKEFIARLQLDPPVEIPGYYAEWEYSSEVLWISLPLSPETEYRARIGKDLKDEFGNTLGQDVDVRFSTTSFSPALYMTTGHGILEASLPAVYSVEAMNLGEITFQARRLEQDELVPFLERPQLFFSNEPLQPEKGFFQVEKKVSLGGARNKRTEASFSLAPLLPEKYGWIFLQADGGQSIDKWERFPKALIQVTGLGLSGKFSPESSVIWVTELATGLPVAGAEVEVRDQKNRVRWRGKTDVSGKAEAPGWKGIELPSREAYSEPRQYVFVRRGGDRAFLVSDWDTGIDPYRFGVPFDWEPEVEEIRGAVFSERGIYRAGEDVHIKGILRRSVKGEWKPLLPSAVDCDIKDPFEKIVFRAKTSLDSFSSFSLDFPIPADAALGVYEVTVRIPAEKRDGRDRVVRGSFRVEAFRPAEFEVHLRAARESIVFGQAYEAEIRGTYLFGGAMEGQPAEWHLRLNRTSFAPPGFDGYVFGNELDWGGEDTDERSRLVSSGRGVLGPEGKLKIQLSVPVEKEKDSAVATLEATVASPSRRSVTSRIQTIVHRGEYYVGLKPSTSFAKKGEPVALDVVAVDPEGIPVAKKKIAVRLVRREWKSVRQAGLGGRWRWVSEREDIVVSSQDVKSAETPVNLVFRPEKAGFYYFQASGSDTLGNEITTTTFFYVIGDDYVPWERRDDDSIELVPDRKTYQPGETARILVKSPYERAKALVSIEREEIFESRVLDIVGTSSQVEIPVKTEYLPNVFVSVLLVQGQKEMSRSDGSLEVEKPGFKIGYARLNIDPGEKRLSVDIDKDGEQFRPGETVNLKFRVRDAHQEGCPASLTVAVVDVGVLNLIGYRTPDAFAEFYAERPLAVRTGESRIHIIERRHYGEKGEEVGGGGAEGVTAPFGLAEVALRGDFRTTAYWNPSLVTDANGEARVTFRLPGNLTTFRVMAVAQTKESQFGRGETSFRVSKDLMLQASLPRFARVGDQFEGGVVIHNFSPARGEAVLVADVKGVRCLEERAERRIPLNPGESREILFSLAAVEPGQAVLSFRSKMGNMEDGLEARIPILLPRPRETAAVFGETRGEAREIVRLPKAIFPAESWLEVQAASSAVTGLKAALDELSEYPYGCLEQRLSSILPYIVAPRFLLEYRLTAFSREEIVRRVEKELREISGFQKDNGGMAPWPEAPASPFLTCYALFALIKAQEAGHAVDGIVLDRAADYLREFLRSEWRPDLYSYGRRTWNSIRAYALYLLALRKEPEPGYAETLYRERDRLSLFGRTCLLKALEYGQGASEARQTLFQELMNMVKIEPETAHFEEDMTEGAEWVYSSNLRTTALILQTMIEIRRESNLLPLVARWIVEKLKAGGRFSTQENFYAIYALSDYFRTFEKEISAFQATLRLDGRVLLQTNFQAGERKVVVSRTVLSEVTAKGGQDLSLNVRKTGDAGVLYYGARLTYAPQDAVPPWDEGMAVWKRIESLEGKPLSVVPAGSLAVVTLELALPQESLFVVVEDPLPAGFEAVNPNFLTESEEARRRLDALDRSPGRRWRAGFTHVEMHDDRVLLFADSLPAGVHVHRYLVRALSSGQFLLPGTKAEKMYAPEVFGRSPEGTVTVKR